MLIAKYTSQFKRDYKIVKKRNLDTTLLNDIISKLMCEEVLDVKFKNHELHGKYEGFKECHIQSNWLLVYLVDREAKTLTLTRTGSHSDLF